MQVSFAFLFHVKRLMILLVSVFSFTVVHGQKKWDGEGHDGLWNTPLNWLDNIVPSATDQVLLDHSAVPGNYVVLLPSGAVGITIRSLTILPASSQTIEVVLPASNQAVPGFTASETGYGLVIHQGGIFRNSSGASSGAPVSISDSIKIYNGGLYIHNTNRAHANNVAVLSTAAGTEQGSFEFDVPGSSGYTISIAGRTYGNMTLSAAAAGGTKSYTSTGTTTVNIIGQFRINSGVSYSLNFNGGFIIHGDFFHHGNVFDISSGLHSNIISIRNNLDHSGLITESGTGLPVLEFVGTNNQQIASTGSITESNTLRVNNSKGITLQTPVSVLFKLELVNGNIRTTSANLLVVHDNAMCSGGTPSSFIEGPLRKIGDDDFEFPVGKQGDYAPVHISGSGGNATDQFEAEYFLGDPAILFGTAIEDPLIVRVSRLEYWNVSRLTGTSQKKLTLSIHTYSNATALEKLVVCRWDTPGNMWRSEGNSGYTGISSGTVTSNVIQSFGVFTIASTVVDQNPLPVFFLDFKAVKQHNDVLLSWKIKPPAEPLSFQVLKAEGSGNFGIIKEIKARSGQSDYEFVEKLTRTGTFHYRLKMEGNGSVRLSEVKIIFIHPPAQPLLAAHPAVVSGQRMTVTVTAMEKQWLQLHISDVMGRAIRSIPVLVYEGVNNVVLEVANIPAGVYYISARVNNRKTNIIRIVKL